MCPSRSAGAFTWAHKCACRVQRVKSLVLQVHTIIESQCLTTPSDKFVRVLRATTCIYSPHIWRSPSHLYWIPTERYLLHSSAPGQETKILTHIHSYAPISTHQCIPKWHVHAKMMCLPSFLLQYITTCTCRTQSTKGEGLICEGGQITVHVSMGNIISHDDYA